MHAMLLVVFLAAAMLSAYGFQNSLSTRRSSLTELGMWGKKKAVPPPPPPPPAPKKATGFSFSFGQKKAAPAPEPVKPAPKKKKTIFNAFTKPDDEEEEEVYDPEGKEKSVAYKARRVARFMTAPWIYNSWDDTEEQARKTIKIKSPPSERERKYAALARGELSQDEIDAIRTNPY